jgi:hypothetical protein
MVSVTDHNNMYLPLWERVEFSGKVHEPKPVIVTPVTKKELRETITRKITTD